MRRLLQALAVHYGAQCIAECSAHVTHLVYGNPTNPAKVCGSSPGARCCPYAHGGRDCVMPQYNFALPRMTSMLSAGTVTDERMVQQNWMWVVSLKWLTDSLQRHSRQPETPYLVTRRVAAAAGHGGAETDLDHAGIAASQAVPAAPFVVARRQARKRQHKRSRTRRGVGVVATQVCWATVGASHRRTCV